LAAIDGGNVPGTVNSAVAVTEAVSAASNSTPTVSAVVSVDDAARLAESAAPTRRLDVSAAVAEREAASAIGGIVDELVSCVHQKCEPSQ